MNLKLATLSLNLLPQQLLLLQRLLLLLRLLFLQMPHSKEAQEKNQFDSENVFKDTIKIDLMVAKWFHVCKSATEWSKD